ncbi:HlyD family efflux transporter periplasmic adaptor subunit [Leptothoe kymatousa]|uniref:HlyD family efflux transporter periplasmic adaptor subunit n=1 Tax=Leptothoe kymatousa TAU-MAC 1615 TaxID=2364775 RepID=A0ABS5Y576_9CYAN|nr:HlyD family efflux transporter periplasmic adaptor subunit [Leptothoe kymatousa]MBT9312643.1 HlyD family efflux transporter periplasmic adaptor subunit [Leptothoe kymatousa TAU-MAC 1615]
MTSQQVQNGGVPNNAPGQASSFDQPVILRQSPLWSRAIVWAILSVTSISILWAFLAQVEETIPAQGKLEPVGVVQPVQTPSGGVIEKIHVREGDLVEKGDVLITFNQEAARTELASLKNIRNQLNTQSEFYRAQGNGGRGSGTIDLEQRLREKNELLASNRIYQAQIDGNTAGLSDTEAAEASSPRQEFLTRQAQNKNQIKDLEGRLEQARLDLENARANLTNAQNDLSTNEEILERLEWLESKGAVAELSRLQQAQEVSARVARLDDAKTRIDNLEEESRRLEAQMSQAKQEMARSEAEFKSARESQMRNNRERISTIDSNLGQTVLQNETQGLEIDSRIAQLEEQLQFRELKAPVSGAVFNMKANQPGYAANSTEPILEIVPQENLIARVFIPNKDIGFVQLNDDCRAAVRADDQAGIADSCKQVDVRIDAFTYSEYGDVDGHLVRIGDDALPPDEIFPFYRFPAEIQLQSQVLESRGETYTLRSGMSLNANIKTEKRTVISFFTDLFVRKKDNFFSK